MANHRFKVGEMVDFVPSRTGVPASVRAYKILRLLPHERGEFLYRIKTIAEAYERIAKESELAFSPPWDASPTTS
jgi:hypothetical protein